MGRINSLPTPHPSDPQTHPSLTPRREAAARTLREVSAQGEEGVSARGWGWATLSAVAAPSGCPFMRLGVVRGRTQYDWRGQFLYRLFTVQEDLCG